MKGEEALNKVIDKMNKTDVVKFADAYVEAAVKSGKMEFKDKNMTIDKWLALPAERRKKVLMKLRTGESDLILSKMEEKLSAKTIIKEIKKDADGNIEIILSDVGKKLKVMADIIGVDFLKHVQNVFHIDILNDIYFDMQVQGNTRVTIK